MIVDDDVDDDVADDDDADDDDDISGVAVQLKPFLDLTSRP